MFESNSVRDRGGEFEDNDQSDGGFSKRPVVEEIIGAGRVTEVEQDESQDLPVEKIQLKRDDTGNWSKVTGNIDKIRLKKDADGNWHNDGAEQNIEAEEVNLVLIPKIEHSSAECIKAKQVKLQKLENFGTYMEVEDIGQFRISTT